MSDTPKPYVTDEQILDRVNEYTLPYRTEITRVTKEFRYLYEAKLQQVIKERDALREALDLMRQFSKMNHVEEVIYDDIGECRITKYTLHEMVDELLNTSPNEQG